jgi:hypothetical protein
MARILSPLLVSLKSDPNLICCVHPIPVQFIAKMAECRKLFANGHAEDSRHGRFSAGTQPAIPEHAPQGETQARRHGPVRMIQQTAYHLLVLGMMRL